MRKYLMAGVATAALMFGVNQAMAQSSMGSGAEKQGATSAQSTTKGASGAMGHSRSEGSKTIGQARDEGASKGMSSSMDRSKSEGSKTIGQARDEGGSKGMSSSTDRSKSEGSKTIGQSRDQSESKGMQPSSKMGERDRDRDRMNGKSKTTTGQSRDEMKNEKGTQSPSSGQMGAQPSTNQNNAQAPSSSSSKMGQGSSNVTTGSASSSATQLTTEQRTEVREKVLANAPRDNNVNFAVNVGTVVPRTVHVAEVPETLIRIHPEWRGHRFFVVHDEIIIVDNDFRIIAVLPV